MSASANNFFKMAMIPCSNNPSLEVQGLCSTNVDGKCIAGGTRVSSSGGYGLASLGFPSKECLSFPLFAASNQAYTANGWRTTNNINPLRLSRPIL